MSQGLRSALGDARGGAGLVVLGGLVAQLGQGVSYLLSPLAPAIVAELSWARGDMMALTSLSTFTSALLNPAIGFLTQRYGARPIVLFGTLWIALLFFGFSRMGELWHLGVLSAGIGLLIATVGDVPVGTVVSRWIAKGRGLALGIVYSGSNVGGALVAGAAALMLDALGWRGTFLWVGCIATAVMTPIVALTVREPPSGYVPPSLAEGEAPDEDSRSAAVGMPLREARRTASFWRLWFAAFLFYQYYITVTSHLALYLTDLGVSQRDAALGYAFLVALGILSKLGFGMVADRWSVKPMLLINFAVIALAAGLLVSMNLSLAFVLPFLVVHGIGSHAQNVSYPLAVAHCFGTRYMAEIYGMILLALFPGSILGPILSGYMHDWLGSYTLIFSVYFAGMLLGLALLSGIRCELPAGSRAAYAASESR